MKTTIDVDAISEFCAAALDSMGVEGAVAGEVTLELDVITDAVGYLPALLTAADAVQTDLIDLPHITPLQADIRTHMGMRPMDHVDVGQLLPGCYLMVLHYALDLLAQRRANGLIDLNQAIDLCFNQHDIEGSRASETLRHEQQEQLAHRFIEDYQMPPAAAQP